MPELPLTPDAPSGTLSLF